jgi:hypothetical protein
MKTSMSRRSPNLRTTSTITPTTWPGFCMTFKPAPWPRKLRSQEWFAGTSKDAIYHRSWMKNQGLPADLFDGRPVIGILNTFRTEPLQRPSERPGRAGEARRL